MANTRGRQVVLLLTNKSGGSVAAGDVVVFDTTADESFTTTTTGRAELSVGVAQETIANNAVGRVLVAGYAALVNVPASVTRGHYVETHTVAKQATGSATRRSGSFGQFAKTSATPSAWLWGAADQTASGGAGALVLLEQQTASASASLDFTTFISSTYDTYRIQIVNLRPATDTASIYVEMGTGGGPTYDTGNNYEWAADGRTSGGVAVTYEGATGLCPVFPAMSNNSAYGFGVADLTLYDPQSTTQRRTMHGSVYYVTSTGPAARQVHWGMQYSAIGTALTALRFIASSGNITSGIIRIYGVTKS